MKFLINIFALILLNSPLYAASDHSLQSAQLSLWWALPFVGILLSLAVWPLMGPNFWHHNFGKISACWAGLVAVPMASIYGLPVATYEIIHTMLLEYIPFITVITALFTISGGIKISCRGNGTPALNTMFLTVATLTASLIGTTGAAMLFIRPLLMMNAWRHKKTHIVIFFIFLVCNIGGCLTALGDPPLFLGFLRGVDFFWPLFNLFAPFLIVSIPLISIFFIIDNWYLKRDNLVMPAVKTGKAITLQGEVNFILLAIVMLAIIISGNWNPGISWRIYDVDLHLQNVMREVILISATVASLKLTPQNFRQHNNFSWGPVLEVAKIFAAIFVAAIPLIAMLRSGTTGPLGFIFEMVNVNNQPNNEMYFYITGALSAFLDNAPTYLIFFHMAGGDAKVLMTTGAMTLTAISCGAVFMGAITYIGNAPNFMVKSIAETHGVPMPGFLGYMGWSVAVLVPLFIILSLIYF